MKGEILFRVGKSEWDTDPKKREEKERTHSRKMKSRETIGWCCVFEKRSVLRDVLFPPWPHEVRDDGQGKTSFQEGFFRGQDAERDGVGCE